MLKTSSARQPYANSKLRSADSQRSSGFHVALRKTTELSDQIDQLIPRLVETSRRDAHVVAEVCVVLPEFSADLCPIRRQRWLIEVSSLLARRIMGDPLSLVDSFTKRQREQARTCCGRTFTNKVDWTTHRAGHRSSPPSLLQQQRAAPSAGIPGVSSGAITPPAQSSALKEASSVIVGTSENASNSPAKLQSRSQTPQTANAENAQMQISRLSLEEGPSNLTGKPSELAALIQRTDTSSPSKKRPASSEVYGHRSSAPRSIHRQIPRQRQDPLASSREPAIATDEFQRGEPRNRTLFDPKSDPLTSKPLPLRSQTTVIPPTETPLREVKFDSHHGVPSSLKREASSSSISKDQLFAEVKGLYRSLEIVEQRCIRLDQGHMADKTKTIKAEGWQALTALHRTLLYEHHDFLLASQHPSAPPELRALASERQIPFRMWKYAIHAYLELLRQHLPESLEFMEAFIYLSYQMMALLYETVTLFEDVWTECLGDLARYRMAIENHSISVREVWTDVARYWYTKASDRQPNVGRLYHHLGILARPHLPQQLYFYNKSLCCVQPFNNAKHSLKAVFEAANTVLSVKPGEKKNEPLQTLDATFVHMHSLIYEKQPGSQITMIVAQVQTLLRDNVSQSDKKWKQYGVFLVISNMAACFSYGAFESPLRRAMEQKNYTSAKSSPKSDPWLKLSIDILSSTTEIILSAKDEKTMLPLLHVLLVLLDSLCNVLRTCNEAFALLAAMPWASIIRYLNDLSKTKDNLTEQVKNAKPEQKFIPHAKNDSRPLTEDFALRGLVWCRDYFPDNWFQGNSNDDLPFHEPASSETARAQRCLWLAVKISAKSEFLQFDKVSCTFTAVAETDKDVSLEDAP